ncbi:unnamed protein product [Polarella glacialis]|uniref:Uncharacterized protein n=1 Tax=Polarella glacialis TaxID=89957 RepID=A0A813EZ10_POLGL|nr:unnamed protein product [Polarella glacialis]
MADIWTGVEGNCNYDRRRTLSRVSGVTNTLVESPKEEDEEKEENEEKDQKPAHHKICADWMEEEPDDVFSDGSWPVFFDVSDAVLVLQEGSKIRTKKLTELYEHIEKVAARVKKRFGPLAWHFDATEQRCVFLQNPRLSLVPVMQRILEDMKNAGSLALGRARALQLKELQVALNTVNSKLGAERSYRVATPSIPLLVRKFWCLPFHGMLWADKKALEMSLTQLTDESWGKDTATKMDEVTTDIIGFYGSYRAQVQARKAHMADPENRRAVMRSAGIDLHALHPELQEKLNLPLDRDLPDVQLQQELQNDLKEPKPSAGKKAVSRVLRLLHAGTVPLKQDLKKESPARALSSELEAPAAMAPSQKTRQAAYLPLHPT